MDHAYVSLISGGDAYVEGIEALGRSLAESGTRVPRIVLATSDVPVEARDRIAATGWEVRLVEPISDPHPEQERTYTRFGRSFTKLRAFGLTGLDKIVFLDADTIVLRNIDELFERPAIAAAPDFFMPDRFNSGVMVVEPRPALLETFMDELARVPSYDGGDQGFLNAHWSDWWAMPVAHRLGAGYNLHHFVFQFMAAHPALERQFLDEVKVVHYTLQKPWRSFTLTGGSSLWWHAYYGAHPERESRLRRRLHALQDWSFDHIVAAVGEP